MFITSIDVSNKLCYDIARFDIDNPIVFQARGKHKNNFLEMWNETKIKRVARDNETSQLSQERVCPLDETKTISDNNKLRE